ncbi:MAG: ecdysteroid 22-kinase family protein [archaeon]|nr:ecdysteroid 22-kinase family protein [archaeon]
MDTKYFPKNSKELTVEWLSKSLESVLNTKIISFSFGDPILPGFTGEVIRIIPKYEKDSPNLPSSFIIKFATANEGIRQFLTNIKGYLKEIKIYKLFKELRIEKLLLPEIFYSNISDDNSYFILIMEDMKNKNMLMVDKEKEIDFNFGLQLVDLFSNFQSKFWNNKKSDGSSDNPNYDLIKWINDYNFGEYIKDITIKNFNLNKEQFLKRNTQRLNEKYQKFIKDLDISKIYENQKRNENLSLLHGDPQPSNIIFNKDKLCLIDWSYINIGICCKDIIILLGIWLSKNTTEEEIKNLKERYYQGLIKGGVKEYSEEMFNKDWNECLLITLANIASVNANDNIGDDIEKVKRYQHYLDLSESRFISFFIKQIKL